MGTVKKIPTSYGHYLNQTGNGIISKGRGSKIRTIDKAFEAYKHNFETGDAAVKRQLTCLLLTECKNWLKNKAQKPTYNKKLGLKSKNSSLLQRRQTIKTVAEECVEALVFAGDENVLAGKFEKKKLGRYAMGDSAKATTPLFAGYTHERTHWQQTGKVASNGAFSGSSVSHSLMNVSGKKQYNQDFANNNALSNIPFGRLVSKQVKLSDLSYEQFVEIGKLSDRAKVRFIKKEERLHYICWVNKDGTLGRTVDKQSLSDCGADIVTNKISLSNYTQVQSDMWMYAMDEYGNLIAKPEEEGDTLPTGFGRFNHSSFNAGKDVMCAGMVLFSKGKLLYLDINSGHYKPTRENLENALQILKDEGADLTHTVAGLPIYDSDGNMKDLELYSAKALMDKVVVPDIV